jgi:hypothetical protein
VVTEEKETEGLTSIGNGVDLVLLALLLTVVVVGVALSGEVPDKRASAFLAVSSHMNQHALMQTENELCLNQRNYCKSWA